ncbi:hypothetical protein HQ529_03580 [Candidatus Woesearchaeota archaeon]|nr:hypothetical protein [Candidatus Woesearchaeota archaeon]
MKLGYKQKEVLRFVEKYGYVGLWMAEKLYTSSIARQTLRGLVVAKILKIGENNGLKVWIPDVEFHNYINKLDN